MLIKKYGAGGTHLAAQTAALDRLAQSRRRPEPPAAMPRAEKPAKPDEAEEAPEKPARGRRKPAAEQPKAEAAEPAKAEPAEGEETNNP